MSFKLSIISNAIICYMHSASQHDKLHFNDIDGVRMVVCAQAPVSPRNLFSAGEHKHALNCTQSADFCARDMCMQRDADEKPNRTMNAQREATSNFPPTQFLRRLNASEECHAVHPARISVYLFLSTVASVYAFVSPRPRSGGSPS